MKKILLLILILSASSLLCAQNKIVTGWRMEFWQLKSLNGDYLTIAKDQTMIVTWDQPLSNEKYEDQPSFGIGDTTGVKKVIDVSLNDVMKNIGQDSIMTCKFEKKLELDPGSWSLIIYAYRDTLFSKHSKPFWFNVKAIPPPVPSLPVEVKIWFK